MTTRRPSTHAPVGVLILAGAFLLCGAARNDDKQFQALHGRRAGTDPARTLTEAEAFLQAWKGSAHTAEAHHIAAEGALGAEAWEQAHRHAEAAMAAGDSAHIPELRLLAATALARGPGAATAVPLLESLVRQEDDLGRAGRAGRELVAVLGRRGQPGDAIAAFEHLFVRALFQGELDLPTARELGKAAPRATLEAIANDRARPGAAGLAALLLLAADGQLNADPTSREARRRWAVTHGDHPLLAEVPEGAALRAEVAQAKAVVGLLLPTTGKYAAPAELVRRGVVAGFAAAAARGLKVPELVVADTGSDPAKARAEWKRLVDEGDVLGILGTMTADEAEVLAPLAESQGVPLLMLVKKPGYGLGRRFVFNSWLLAEEQAGALATHLLERMQIERVAIVYPEREPAALLADRIWTAFEAGGGSVTGVESFGGETTDFRPTARRLLGAEPATSTALPLLPTRLRPQAGRESVLLPGTDFQALVVPDGYKSVSMLAPGFLYEEINLGGHLPQKNRPPVLLAGGSALNHPDLVGRAGKYVEGTTIVDAFFGGSSDPAVRAFVDNYRLEWKSEPSVLEATGFDLALAFAEAAARAGPDRAAMAGALRDTQVEGAVAGARGFGADGEMRHQPLILQVKDGVIVQAWPEPPPPAPAPGEQP